MHQLHIEIHLVINGAVRHRVIKSILLCGNKIRQLYLVRPFVLKWIPWAFVAHHTSTKHSFVYFYGGPNRMKTQFTTITNNSILFTATGQHKYINLQKYYFQSISSAKVRVDNCCSALGFSKWSIYWGNFPGKPAHLGSLVTYVWSDPWGFILIFAGWREYLHNA